MDGESRFDTRSLWACVLVIGLTWCGTAGAAIVDRIVARAGDEVITEYELEQALRPYLLQQGKSPAAVRDAVDDPSVRRDVLEEMIDRHLVSREADEMGLSIDESKVDQMIEMTRRRRGMSADQFRSTIDRYGISMDQYRTLLRHNLLKRQLLQAKLGGRVSVSSSEVDQVYRRRFGSADAGAKEVKVRHILVQPGGSGESARRAAEERAGEVLEKLEEGTSFADLAKQYSDDPSASDGGLLGTFRRGELQSEIEEAAFSLEAGEHSELIRTEYGFHIVRVDEVRRTAGKQSEERRSKIRRELKQEKLKDELDSFLRDLRSETLVEVEL